MSRPKKSANHAFSPAQAVFILERAIADRKISAADLKGYLTGMADEIASLEARLSALKQVAVAPAIEVATLSVQGGDGPFPKAVTKNRKRKKPVSPEVAATRIVQSQYLTHLRQIPKTKRAKYQRMAKTESREAAIAAMKKALGK